MQELVAGLLRAMGYKTRVAKPGSHRGTDILASPDEFAFEQHRITVEVKHRNSAMTASEKAIFRNYEQMDIETQKLLPLKKIYWPV